MARSSRNLPEGCFEFFITARCANKEWFKIPLPEVWDIFSRYLAFISHSYDIQIRAFILMANHFHLIVSADSANLPPAMNYLMRESAKEINRLSGRINQVWGRPYHSACVIGYVHYQNVYKYLYRNPVEAGICERVEEYPYSTVQGLLGFSHLLIPVQDEILLNDVEFQLEWLNRKPSAEKYREEIRKGLGKRTFSFGLSKDRVEHPNNRTPI
ncbi:MAG: transposase [Bdellovibrionales bacterium]|nr:transposase [Bdellovibrionales bacterium]